MKLLWELIHLCGVSLQREETVLVLCPQPLLTKKRMIRSACFISGKVVAFKVSHRKLLDPHVGEITASHSWSSALRPPIKFSSHPEEVGLLNHEWVSHLAKPILKQFCWGVRNGRNYLSF